MIASNKDKKEMLNKVMYELEKTLCAAIDADKVGNLNVFEMIIVAAETLNGAYKAKPVKKTQGDNVVQLFKKK